MSIREGATKGVKILSTWFGTDKEARNELMVHESGPSKDCVSLTVWSTETATSATVKRADLLEALGVSPELLDLAKSTLSDYGDRGAKEDEPGSIGRLSYALGQIIQAVQP